MYCYLCWSVKNYASLLLWAAYLITIGKMVIEYIVVPKNIPYLTHKKEFFFKNPNPLKFQLSFVRFLAQITETPLPCPLHPQEILIPSVGVGEGDMDIFFGTARCMTDVSCKAVILVLTVPDSIFSSVDLFLLVTFSFLLSALRSKLIRTKIDQVNKKVIIR